MTNVAIRKSNLSYNLQGY